MLLGQWVDQVPHTYTEGIVLAAASFMNRILLHVGPASLFLPFPVCFNYTIQAKKPKIYLKKKKEKTINPKVYETNCGKFQML